MARWKLLQPHYLNLPGTKWEYTENDRATGKPVRRQFDVPTFLHPETPGDWNDRNGEEGIIVVSNKQDNAHPKDYLYIGAPTPDMEPLDDEASAISAKLAPGWSHAINDLPSQGGYSQSLLDNLQTQAAAAQSKTGEAVAAQAEGMKEILATMAAMMKQNQELITTLAEARVALAPTTSALGGTRVLYAQGTLEVSGECQGQWQALSASASTNPLTVTDSNV